MGVFVNLELSALDAEEAIQQLAEGVARDGGVKDAAQLLVDIQAREAALPTYVGEGVAFPHARTDAVSSRVLAIGRSRAGVPFGPKREAAHLIILVGCPREEIIPYLEFSKQVMTRLRQADVRAGLMTATTACAFLKLLELEDEADGVCPASR